METVEIWKDIREYECVYQISNFGRVKFLGGFKKNHSKNIWMEEKIFSLSNNGKYRHRFVRIKGKKYYVHRLVAQAFLGIDINNSKICVCHKDDNPRNNRVDNLFLGTIKDNHDDMKKKGRMAVNYMLPQTKLSKEIIEFIRDSKGKINQYLLAKMFNIDQSHISRIQNNISRKYV